MGNHRIALGVVTVAFGLALTVGTAVADDLPGNGCSVPCPPPSSQVQPTTEVNAPATAPASDTAVLGASETNGAPAAVAPAAATSSSSGLPFTGADVVGLTVVGLAAIGTGILLVRRSRARA
jgi:hypothetical protein